MIQSEDLFLVAFALLRGGEMGNVSVRGTNGRRVAVFCIEGDEAAQAEREYRRGRALVDLRLLKTEVRRLKDVAFQALREEEIGHARQPRGDRRDQEAQRPWAGRGRAWD